MFNYRQPSQLAFVLLLVLHAGTTASAGLAPGDVGGICPPDEFLAPLAFTPIVGDDVIVDADQGSTDSRLVFDMAGHVQLRRFDQLLLSDQLHYDRPADHLRATGSVRFQQPGIVIRGAQADLEHGGHKGEVTDAAYFMLARGARGEAQTLSFEDNRVELRRATYSTCAEPKKSWMLRAQSLVLDNDANEGIAKNVTLRIADVPVLYLPYASFPLQGRKSGLLPPEFGNSDSGLDLRTPYYLNLAPHRDATIIPRIMSNRGLQVGGQLRYLNATNKGVFNGEYLPDDARTNSARRLVTFNHQQRVSSAATVEAQVQDASDPDYFRDLGGSLSVASQTQLDRFVTGRWAARNWTASALIQDFQSLDRQQAKPYRRLPQITLDGSGGQAVHTFWHTDYSYFDRPTGPVGHRLLLEPGISAPMAGDAFFFTPSWRFRHVNYVLSDTGAAPSESSFNAGALNIDSGIFLERDGDHYTQTLEPRLTYIYAPATEQTGQPLFDTGVVDFDLGQLFRDNRYSGGDRFGDDHHFTAALTNRWVDSASGREYLRVTLAQATYLRDQQVVIPGEIAVQQGDARRGAEVAARLSRQLTTRASGYTEKGSAKPSKGAIQVHYAGTRNTLDLSYRFRRDTTEHAALTGLLHVNSNWRVAGRWLYSLRDAHTQEAVIGLEYDNCCWGIRLAARRYVEGAEMTYQTSYGIQVELKGLSSFGSRLDEKFTQEFLGFAPEG